MREPRIYYTDEGGKDWSLPLSEVPLQDLQIVAAGEIQHADVEVPDGAQIREAIAAAMLKERGL